MRNLKIWIVFCVWMLASAGCQGEDGDDDDEAVERASKPAAPRTIPQLIQQIPPPVDLQAPPADAARTGTGLTYVKLAANEAGARAQRSDTALVHYTGWRQRSGETFFTTRGRGRPISLAVAHTAPGFAEVLPLLRKGEKAVVWVPASPGTPEALVYEVEVVDVVAPVAAARKVVPGDASPTSGSEPGKDGPGRSTDEVLVKGGRVTPMAGPSSGSSGSSSEGPARPRRTP